jgi:hypothetical protein
VIIWGNRTKREGRGFVLKNCVRCGGEKVHFVAEAKTKFTLYFVPTFTYSTKALLICTQCERQETFDGTQGQSYLHAALSPDELQRRQVGQQETAGTGETLPAPHSLAVGMLVMALQVSLTDGTVDDAESVAISQGFATIRAATKSEPVRQAAGLVVDGLSEIMTWISAPATGPLPLMLAKAGQVVRQFDPADQSRYIGQVAWLGDVVAGAHGQSSGGTLEQVDSGLERMGFSPQEVAAALAFCDQNGG